MLIFLPANTTWRHHPPKNHCATSPISCWRYVYARLAMRLLDVLCQLRSASRGHWNAILVCASSIWEISHHFVVRRMPPTLPEAFARQVSRTDCESQLGRGSAGVGLTQKWPPCSRSVSDSRSARCGRFRRWGRRAGARSASPGGRRVRWTVRRRRPRGPPRRA